MINELELYKKLLNKSDIVSTTDVSGIITYVNDKFCEVSGYSREELIGRNHNIVRHPNENKALFKRLWDTIKTGETFTGIIRNRKKNGDTYFVDSTVSPVLEEDGTIMGYIAIRHEINHLIDKKTLVESQILNYSKPILFLFTIDSVADLYSLYTEQEISELFNEVLFSIKSNFTSFKKADFFNIEQNKLMLLMEQECFDNQEHINELLIKITNSIVNQTFSFGSITEDFFVECLYSTDSQNLLNDVLLPSAKHSGQLNVSGVYVRHKKEALRKKKIIKDVEEALSENRMSCYFQPIVHNTTDKIEKVEALIRMIDREGNVISPYFFLNAVKESHIYHDITCFVLSKSIEMAEKTGVEVSLNLSFNDLRHPLTRDRILNGVGKKPGSAKIMLEILEDMEFFESDDIMPFFDNKTEKDFKVSVDDFGVGYSNYERILKTNPDIIKIDGSLIKNIEYDVMSKSIVEMICLFGKRNGIQTVAEYVENERILKIVKELGVDYSQGYHLGKPISFNEMIDLLTSQQNSI